MIYDYCVVLSLSCNNVLQVEDIDTDETQCIVASLIDKVCVAPNSFVHTCSMQWASVLVLPMFSQSYIKGYISHQHQKLVVSKQNPFPKVTQEVSLK